MGVIIRQSIKNSVYSYAGFALGAFNTLLIMPRVLEKAQVGLLNTLVAYSWIMAILLTLGMQGVVIRYFSRFRDDQKGRFLFLVMLVPLLGFTAFTTAFFLSPDTFLNLLHKKEALFIENYRYAFWMAFGNLFFELFSAWMKSHLITGPSILLRELALRIFNLVLYAAYFYDIIGFETLVIGYAASYPGIFLILFGYAAYRKTLSFELKLPDHSRREMSSFALYNLFNAGVIYVVFQLDVVMLQNYSGLEDVALYTISVFAATVIQLPYRALTTIALPVIARSFSENDLKNVADVYRKSSHTMLLIGGIIYVLLVVCIPHLKFFLPPEYRDGIEFCVIVLGLAKWIDVSTGLNSAVISQSSYYRFDIVANMALLFTAFLTNYLLIPMYGIKGAVFATLISLSFFNFVRVGYIQYKLHMGALTVKSIFSVIVLGLLISVGLLLPDLHHPVANIALRACSVLLLFTFALYKFRLSEDITDLISTAGSKVKNKISK
jgi:O-antigen/teichoic acid export membrane protein